MRRNKENTNDGWQYRFKFHGKRWKKWLRRGIRRHAGYMWDL